MWKWFLRKCILIKNSIEWKQNGKGNHKCFSSAETKAVHDESESSESNWKINPKATTKGGKLKIGKLWKLKCSSSALIEQNAILSIEKWISRLVRIPLFFSPRDAIACTKFRNQETSSTSNSPADVSRSWKKVSREKSGRNQRCAMRWRRHINSRNLKIVFCGSFPLPSLSREHIPSHACAHILATPAIEAWNIKWLHVASATTPGHVSAM